MIDIYSEYYSEYPEWAHNIGNVVGPDVLDLRGHPRWGELRRHLILEMRRAVADLPPDPIWLEPIPTGVGFWKFPYAGQFNYIIRRGGLNPRSPMVGESAMSVLLQFLDQERPQEWPCSTSPGYTKRNLHP